MEKSKWCFVIYLESDNVEKKSTVCGQEGKHSKGKLSLGFP